MTWRGQWIWIEGESSPRNAYVYFLRKCNLDFVPPKAVAWISADSRYIFYVNGQRRGVEQQLAKPLMTNAAPFLIGTSTDGFPLAGLVDEVAIFNRALTATEIQRIYDAGSAGLCRAAEFVSVTQINREQVEFKLKGLTGKDVTIYSTSNFLDWLPVLTLPNGDGVLTLVDPAAKSGWRFYRASAP